MLISVHGNAFSNESAAGWEVHTYLGRTVADDIAEIFWKEAQILSGTDFAMRKESAASLGKNSNFAIVRDTKCPAILTESLFFTNYRDCMYMLSDAGQTVIALIHLNGCLRVMGRPAITLQEFNAAAKPEEPQIAEQMLNINAILANAGLFY
jgi:N-acetylmuramoyl-L-alanine amidase